MMTVSFSDASVPSCPAVDEWFLLRTGRPNALLIGSKARVNAAIAGLCPYLRAPLVEWHPRAVVEPPQEAVGTLIICGVETLDLAQQERFLAWLHGHAANDVQVLSVAERPVYPLVVREEFLEALYYRLNVLCLVMADDREESLMPRSRSSAARHA